MAEDEAEPEIPPEQEEGVEYSIVVFHHLQEGEEESQQETIDRTQDMDHALRKAESLSYTGEYHKVEVKKIFKDKENDREVEMTLKLYEGSLKKPASLAEIMLATVLFGILAFLVSFFGIKYYDLQQKKLEDAKMEASLVIHAEQQAQKAAQAAAQAAENPQGEDGATPVDEEKDDLDNPFITLFD